MMGARNGKMYSMVKLTERKVRGHHIRPKRSDGARSAMILWFMLRFSHYFLRAMGDH